MLTKQSSPVDIEYHIEQMKILRVSDKEVEVIQKILQLESIISDKSVKKFIDKEVAGESWNYESQLLINSCKKKLEKDVVIKNHIKECYNFLIFRSLEDKLVNFPTVVVSKEGNIKNYKWIFTCHSRHEGDDSVRWANMKLNKAMENSTTAAFFEMMKDEHEEVVINEKWLIDNKQSFYSVDIFEDTNTLLQKKAREKSKAIVASHTNHANDVNTEVLAAVNTVGDMVSEHMDSQADDTNNVNYDEPQDNENFIQQEVDVDGESTSTQAQSVEVDDYEEPDFFQVAASTQVDSNQNERGKAFSLD